MAPRLAKVLVPPICTNSMRYCNSVKIEEWGTDPYRKYIFQLLPLFAFSSCLKTVGDAIDLIAERAA